MMATPPPALTPFRPVRCARCGTTLFKARAASAGQTPVEVETKCRRCGAYQVVIVG